MKIRAALDRPPKDWPTDMKVLSEEMREERWGPVMSRVLPAMDGASDSLLMAEAAQALSELALAATAYRRDEGKYPASLEELVPEYIDTLPPDPFTGNALKEVGDGDGIVLYSVSRDRRDDRGKVQGWADMVICLGDAYEEHRIERAPGSE